MAVDTQKAAHITRYTIITNGVSLLQTKFSHRERHEARGVGLEAMPLDQHIEADLPSKPKVLEAS